MARGERSPRQRPYDAAPSTCLKREVSGESFATFTSQDELL